MTADPGFAILSLSEILERALGAVERAGMIGGLVGCKFLEKNFQGQGNAILIGDEPVLAGWDMEFARMTRKEQVKWLIHLFAALTMGEVSWVTETLREEADLEPMSND